MAEEARRRARLSPEKLLDKAERLMSMKGLSPTGAVRAAMPDDLLQIPLDELRILAESALIARLAQRRSRQRYRDTEQRSQEVNRLVQQAMTKINAKVQKKAEVLARVTYVMKGVPVPLLTMSLDDHISKRLEAQRAKASAEARFKFHDQAVQALKGAVAENIAALSVDEITQLADLAEQVWGPGV